MKDNEGRSIFIGLVLPAVAGSICFGWCIAMIFCKYNISPILREKDEVIESLRAEIKTYQAIGNIVDSRCVDVMEVGE